MGWRAGPKAESICTSIGCTFVCPSLKQLRWQMSVIANIIDAFGLFVKPHSRPGTKLLSTFLTSWSRLALESDVLIKKRSDEGNRFPVLQQGQTNKSHLTWLLLSPVTSQFSLNTNKDIYGCFLFGRKFFTVWNTPVHFWWSKSDGNIVRGELVCWSWKSFRCKETTSMPPKCHNGTAQRCVDSGSSPWQQDLGSLRGRLQQS